MNQTQWFRHKVQNGLQSVLLLISLTSLVGYLGWILAGMWMALMVVIIVILAYFFNPLMSPSLVLRIYRGQKIFPEQAPQLYEILRILSQRAGLNKIPTLYYLPSNVMNAFATGYADNTTIGISDGLLRRMNLSELTAILAHEISHLRNDDLRVMAFADFTSRLTYFFSMLGQILIFICLPLIFFEVIYVNWIPIFILLFAPVFGALIQLALSRTREFDADLGAAELLGSSIPLARALEKVERYQGSWLERIIWPGRKEVEPSILRTHPETQERIHRLLELQDFNLSPITDAFVFRESYYPTNLLSQVPIRPKRYFISGIWY